MDSTSTVIAVASTLISSAALVGVMIGLFLQARQLRVNNIQTFREGHAELIRMAVDYPDLWVDPADKVSPNPDLLRRHSLLNWWLLHLRFGYNIGALPEATVRWEAAYRLTAAYRRDWWRLARDSYIAAVNSRRDRRFITIIDEEYDRAVALSVAATAAEQGR